MPGKDVFGNIPRLNSPICAGIDEDTFRSAEVVALTLLSALSLEEIVTTRSQQWNYHVHRRPYTSKWTEIALGHAIQELLVNTLI